MAPVGPSCPCPARFPRDGIRTFFAISLNTLRGGRSIPPTATQSAAAGSPPLTHLARLVDLRPLFLTQPRSRGVVRKRHPPVRLGGGVRIVRGGRLEHDNQCCSRVLTAEEALVERGYIST